MTSSCKGWTVSVVRTYVCPRAEHMCDMKEPHSGNDSTICLKFGIPTNWSDDQLVLLLQTRQPSADCVPVCIKRFPRAKEGEAVDSFAAPWLRDGVLVFYASDVEVMAGFRSLIGVQVPKELVHKYIKPSVVPNEHICEERRSAETKLFMEEYDKLRKGKFRHAHSSYDAPSNDGKSDDAAPSDGADAESSDKDEKDDKDDEDGKHGDGKHAEREAMAFLNHRGVRVTISVPHSVMCKLNKRDDSEVSYAEAPTVNALTLEKMLCRIGKHPQCGVACHEKRLEVTALFSRNLVDWPKPAQVEKDRILRKEKAEQDFQRIWRIGKTKKGHFASLIKEDLKL